MGLALDRRGLREWLIQRISAVLMGLYTLFIVAFCLTHAPMSYTAWHALMSHGLMKIFTFIILLSILWHAWIGLWTVLTDYVKQRMLRLFLEIIILLLLLTYAWWTVDILWVV